jgi:hypothetical protein
MELVCIVADPSAAEPQETTKGAGGFPIALHQVVNVGPAACQARNVPAVTR